MTEKQKSKLPLDQRFFIIFLAIMFCGSLVFAADKDGIETGYDAGFESIFNGKDLAGWDGDPRLWSVVDGSIRGKTTPENKAKGNTFCVWRGGKLKNFILKIQFRIENGNSGIQYRSKENDKWRISGYQAEVENKQGKVGFLYHEKGRGWLVNVGDIMVIDKDGRKNVTGKIADQKGLIKKGYYREKDWNEYTIICRGNHIVHYLNGMQTIELIDNDVKNRLMEGLLALQIHAGPPMTVEFKNIRIKHLPGHFGDAVRLFNGKDLKSWTYSSDKVKDAWSVKDGIMINKGKPIGYIRTKKDFTSYILRLQHRHLGKGNGGVLLRMVGEDKVWPCSIEAQGQFNSAGDIWNIDKFPMKAAEDRTKGRHTRKMHPSNEKPVGQWNQYEIALDGERLELKVNELVQNIAKKCWQTPGKICLQSEGSPMEFRNLVLIPIIKAKYHVAIIQAAGYLPDTKPPEGTDAITHATTKVVNTYIITSALVDQLAAKGIEVQVIAYSACDDLKCLYPTENNGKKQVVDVVVFAGPAENSKQQKKILELFPQLEEVVKRSPHIICTSIVPAWYPETKGQEACTYSDNCFKKAGAKTVRGISLLTPRKDNPGVSKENMEKVLNKFADDLISAMQ